MLRKQILEAFDDPRVWKRRGVRSPRKPLVELYALGQWAGGDRHGLQFHEVEANLQKLLSEFGRPEPQSSARPLYPFWCWLQDGAASIRIWEIEGAEKVRTTASGDAYLADLRVADCRGTFISAVRAALDADPALASQFALRLLEAHFLKSWHDDILGAVGLSAAEPHGLTLKRAWGTSFRKRVLAAYGHRYAVCRGRVRIGGVSIALNAARIQWHCADGPDIGSNGLVPCPTHHKIFDRGAFTING